MTTPTPAARLRKSFWLTAEDMAALAVMAGGGDEPNCSAKLRDLIRAAWQGWPAAEALGAVPAREAAEEPR